MDAICKDKMREGMEKVDIAHRIDRKSNPQLEQMITATAEEHLFYAPITNLLKALQRQRKKNSLKPTPLLSLIKWCLPINNLMTLWPMNIK